MKTEARWPIALSTGCFYQQPISACLEPIRRAGFEWLEICSSPAHLNFHHESRLRDARRQLDNLGLKPYSLHAPFADDVDISAEDDNIRDYGRREMLQAVHAAAELNADYVVLHPGPERGGFTEEQHLRRRTHVAEVLDEIIRECRSCDVHLLLENMLPHLFSGHVRDLLWLLGAVREWPLGFCLDTGHAHLGGELETAVTRLSGHLRMLHAADNHGKGDDHLPPGQGEIDWERLLRQLADVGFDGVLVLEIVGQGNTAETLQKARAGRAFLRSVMGRENDTQQE